MIRVRDDDRLTHDDPPAPESAQVSESHTAPGGNPPRESQPEAPGITPAIPLERLFHFQIHSNMRVEQLVLRSDFLGDFRATFRSVQCLDGVPYLIPQLRLVNLQKLQTIQMRVVGNDPHLCPPYGLLGS